MKEVYRVSVCECEALCEGDGKRRKKKVSLEEGNQPFLSSIVTVSLAHFIRNLDVQKIAAVVSCRYLQ